MPDMRVDKEDAIDIALILFSILGGFAWLAITLWLVT
jgi:hypothetical protein